MRWIFLPGLDGTGWLLEPVLQHVPAHVSSTLVRYPINLKGTYDDYVRLAAEVVSGAGEEVVLIGESFSGPVTVLLASMFPERVKAVVLAASFVSHPVSRRWKPLLRYSDRVRGHAPGFSWPIKLLLTGFDFPERIVKTVQRIAATVPASVLLHRLKLVLDVDERGLVSSLPVPVLALVAQRDRLIPNSYLGKMRAAKPDLDCRLFDTPHLLLERQPAEAVACIEGFLSARNPQAEKP